MTTLTTSRTTLTERANPRAFASSPVGAGTTPGGTSSRRRGLLPGPDYMHENTRDQLRRVRDPQQLAEDEIILTPEDDTSLSAGDVYAIAAIVGCFTALIAASISDFL